MMKEDLIEWQSRQRLLLSNERDAESETLVRALRELSIPELESQGHTIRQLRPFALRASAFDKQILTLGKGRKSIRSLQGTAATASSAAVEKRAAINKSKGGRGGKTSTNRSGNGKPDKFANGAGARVVAEAELRQLMVSEEEARQITGSSPLPSTFKSGDEVALIRVDPTDPESEEKLMRAYLTAIQEDTQRLRRRGKGGSANTAKKTTNETTNEDETSGAAAEDDRWSTILGGGTTLCGVVHAMSTTTIEVLLRAVDPTFPLDGYFCAVPLPNDKTYSVMNETLDSLISRPPPLMKLLFDQEEQGNDKDEILWMDTSLPVVSAAAEIEAAETAEHIESIANTGEISSELWCNSALNPPQRHAVRVALNSKLVSLIHGPPGTGKTATLTEVILQLIRRGDRVLVCAPSNVATDTLMLRVMLELRRITGTEADSTTKRTRKVKKSTKSAVDDPSANSGGFTDTELAYFQESLDTLLRIGHPARIDDALHAYTLDSSLESNDKSDGKALRDARKEVDTWRSALLRLESGQGVRPEGGGKLEIKVQGKGAGWTFSDVRGALRTAQKELMLTEKTLAAKRVSSARVVFATCIGSANAARILRRDPNQKTGWNWSSDGDNNEKDQKGLYFDTCVVDEAAQALEAACWTPISFAKRAILAGDHLQLPPLIRGLEHGQAVLDRLPCSRCPFEDDPDSDDKPEVPDEVSAVTLFGKIQSHPSLAPVRALLSCQYRMHEQISRWSNAVLYHNKLSAAPAVKAHTLYDLFALHPHNQPSNDLTTLPEALSTLQSGGLFPPVLYLDTSKLSFFEDPTTSGSTNSNATSKLGTTGWISGPSHRNFPEACLAIYHAAQIAVRGVSTSNMAILTPYHGQRRLLQGILRSLAAQWSESSLAESIPFPLEGLTVSSIDSFQGGERDVIIFPWVRSNTKRSTGFLGDYRRMNVAITRARRHLVLIADSDTVSASPTLASILRFASKEAQAMSIQDYLEVYPSVGFLACLLDPLCPPLEIIEAEDDEDAAFIETVIDGYLEPQDFQVDHCNEDEDDVNN